MKRVIPILLSLLRAASVTNASFNSNHSSFDSIPAEVRDVESMDGIIAALYDVISGAAGQSRNWDRMRTLFNSRSKVMKTMANLRMANGGCLKRRTQKVANLQP